VTTTPSAPGDPVAARLDALRSALAPPAASTAPTASTTLGEPLSGGLLPDGLGDGDLPVRGGELADRLRARRSAAHVAAAYSAANGHPWHDDPQGRRRWALAPAAAVAAAVALLAVVIVVVALAWPRGEVSDLGVAVSGGAPAGQNVGVDGAPDGALAGEPDEGGSGGGAAEGRSADEGAPDGGTVATDGTGGEVVVHVVGEVAEPGLVTLPAGSRVADAVEAAGGPTDDADLSAVNLARDVVDGEQVLVPAPGQAVPAPADATTGASGGPGAGGAGGTGGQVPLNTADATALMELPGVGPVLAERIIAWRDENGPFTSVEELTEVSGIGPAVLEKLRDQVLV
jgi:competence protein ComEA